MISVTVKIHGSFRRFLAPGMTGRELKISLEDEACVGDLLRDQIGLTAESPRVVLVNGVHASLATKLTDCDRVSIFSPVAGG